MSESRIESRKDGGLGWMIFSNPARLNAVSVAMWEAIPRVLEAFAADGAIRCIVLAGAGERAFVSGADISQFEAQRSGPEAVQRYEELAEGAQAQLAAFEKPTVAMVRGYCLGGGLNWATACDLRVCSDDAQFGIPIAKLSLAYSPSTLRPLIDLVGPSTAKEMLFTARRYSASEALRLGLVNQVVPSAELDDFVASYAGAIAAGAPLSLLSSKTTVTELVKEPADRDLDLVARRIDAAASSADHTEGRRAFLEKRKPVFTGR
jgi:enoyl-CoA hydratase